jgi:hypothetical protein
MKLEIGQWYAMGGTISYVFAEDTYSIRPDQYYVIQRRIAKKEYGGYPFEMRSANYEGITTMRPIKMPRMSSLSKHYFITSIFWQGYL